MPISIYFSKAPTKNQAQKSLVIDCNNIIDLPIIARLMIMLKMHLDRKYSTNIFFFSIVFRKTSNIYSAHSIFLNLEMHPKYKIIPLFYLIQAASIFFKIINFQ
jgi:hypothetical protein